MTVRLAGDHEKTLALLAAQTLSSKPEQRNYRASWMTCAHVAKQIDDRKLPSGRRFFVLVSELSVCDSCFNSLGLEKFARMAELSQDEHIKELANVEEAFIAAMTAFEGRRMFCVKCIAELEGQASPV